MRDWQHGLKGSTAKDWQYLPPVEDPTPKVLGCFNDAITYANRRAVHSGARQRVSVGRCGTWLVQGVE